MLNILHTADWHLGLQRYGYSYQKTQAQFLNHLHQQLCQYTPNALIISGDIFDSPNPPNWAMHLYYQFLAKTKQANPNLQIIIIAGNHDAPSRLDAPKDLLNHFNIHVIGTCPKNTDKTINYAKLIIPITHNQQTLGFIGAIPFLRPSDFPHHTNLKTNIQQTYHTLFQTIQSQNPTNTPIILTGHLTLYEAKTSPNSERPLYFNQQEAIAHHALPPADYIALGHLHLAQQFDHPHTAYPGAPYPLALNEKDHPHGIMHIAFQHNQIERTHLPLPPFIRLRRLPETGYAPLQDIEKLLTTLTDDPDRPTLLTLAISLDTPVLDLQQKVHQWIQHKSLILAKIDVQYPHQEHIHHQTPETLSVENVFDACYEAAYQTPPPHKYRQLLAEIIDETSHENPQYSR